MSGDNIVANFSTHQWQLDYQFATHTSNFSKSTFKLTILDGWVANDRIRNSLKKRLESECRLKESPAPVVGVSFCVVFRLRD